MSENLVALHGARGVGFHPEASLASRSSSAVGLRFPHRDAVHAAQSGGVETQVQAIRSRHDDVMRELVLDHDVHDLAWRREGKSPADDDRTRRREPFVYECDPSCELSANIAPREIKTGEVLAKPIGIVGRLLARSRHIEQPPSGFGERRSVEAHAQHII